MCFVHYKLWFCQLNLDSFSSIDKYKKFKWSKNTMNIIIPHLQVEEGNEEIFQDAFA